MFFSALLIHADETIAAKKSVATFTVKKIKLKGVQKHPEQNISRSILQDKLDDWRDEHYPQKKLSLEQLNDLAFRVSKYYQNLGFSFVTAFVPKQKIRKGVVYIRVKEDKLTDINVRNVEDWSRRRAIESEFRSMLGRPVFKPKLEEPIMLLNDNPNQNIFAYFSRGKNKGETRLNLNVIENKSATLSLGANNHGSKSVGEEQQWIRTKIYNLFGWNDVISFDVNQVIDTEDNLSGTASYEKFIGNRESYTVSVSRNEYELGEDLAILQLQGSYSALRAQYKNKTVRTASLSKSHIYNIDYRESELTSDFIINSLDQKNSALLTGYQYSSTDYQISQGDYLTKSIQLSGIFTTEGEEQLEEEAFVKLNGFLQWGKNIGNYVPGLNSRLTTNFSFQYSAQNLPSADKTSLTGPSAVRAFEPGVFSADQSALIQFKWAEMYQTDYGQWQPYLFYDHAFGIRKISDEEVEAELSGFGLGLNYRATKWLKVEMSYGVSQETQIGELDKESQSLFLLSLESQVFWYEQFKTHIHYQFATDALLLFFIAH